MSGALALLRRRPRFRALWAGLPDRCNATSPRAAFLIAAAGGLLVTAAVAPTLLRAPAVGPRAAG